MLYKLKEYKQKIANRFFKRETNDVIWFLIFNQGLKTYFPNMTMVTKIN